MYASPTCATKTAVVNLPCLVARRKALSTSGSVRRMMFFADLVRRSSSGASCLLATATICDAPRAENHEVSNALSWDVPPENVTKTSLKHGRQRCFTKYLFNSVGTRRVSWKKIRAVLSCKAAQGHAKSFPFRIKRPSCKAAFTQTGNKF